MNVNEKKCFVTICLSKIAIAITTSRKHVRRGFVCVCYIDLFNAKPQMVEGTTLNEVWRIGWCKVG
jgi:hypothetical protein